MKAEEARKLTELNLTGSLQIEGWLQHIYKRIEAMAVQGKTEITDPFKSSGFSLVRMALPSAEQTKAIYQKLEADGYVVSHHANPDPDDQRSSDYATVSW